MIRSWADVDIPSLVVLVIVIGVFIWSQFENARSRRRREELYRKMGAEQYPIRRRRR